MLTTEEKKAMVDHRVKFYESKIFELEMDRAASAANEDKESVKQIDKMIDGYKKASEAVGSMIANEVEAS